GGGHADGGDAGDDQRDADGDKAKHWLDGELEGLTVDQERAAGELAEPRGFQCDERPVKQQEREAEERRENRCLNIDRLPENRAEAQGIEPEGSDVVGQHRFAAEREGDEHGENDQPAASPPRRSRRRPVEGIHFTPRSATWTSHLLVTALSSISPSMPL